MQRKWIFSLALAGFLIISAVSASGVVAESRKTGPVWETPPPEARLHLVPQTPESTPGPHTCGYWSSPDGAVGGPLSQMYGELRNCGFFDNAWIITTLGLKGQSGVLALYRCAPADAACLDGQTEHPLAGWQIYMPPCATGLTWVRNDPARERIEVLGRCTMWFNLASGTFSDK